MPFSWKVIKQGFFEVRVAGGWPWRPIPLPWALRSPRVTINPACGSHIATESINGEHFNGQGQGEISKKTRT